MKSNALFCALLSVFILFNSCKKSDKEVDKITISIPKIKTITYYKGDSITSHTSFEYDTSGKLSKSTYSNGQSFTFSYAPSNIIRTYYYIISEKPSIDTLILNNKGLVISEEGGITTYEYTPEGYQSKLTIDASPKTSQTYTSLDGNIIKNTERNYNDVRYIHTYTFLSDIINTIGNENMGITYFGKQDKNLKSKDNTIDLRDNKTFQLTYEYEFDTKNRVTKLKKIGWYSYNDSETYTYYE